MVARLPIKVRLQDYKPWQIGLAGLLGVGLILMVCWWSLASSKYKTQGPVQVASPSSSKQPSAFRPPFRTPDFEVPDLRTLPPNRPLTKRGPDLEPSPQILSATVRTSRPETPPEKQAHLPPMQAPLLPPMEVPGAVPGSLPGMAMQSMPGVAPSLEQLSPKFFQKIGGFVGPDPFAMMPQGAAPNPEIFARQPRVEMPRPPTLPGMPAPPKGYLDQVHSALEDARRRLSQPHPGIAAPANFVEPAPQPTTKPHSRELPQG